MEQYIDLRYRYLQRLILKAIFCLFFLSACERAPLPHPNFSPYRPLNSYQRNLMTRIYDAGGKVIKQGDVLKVILPVDEFFKLQTADVKPNKRKALIDVAYFIKSYTTRFRHPIILVNGYSDKVFARKTRRQISRQYADVVAAYLWNNGINRNRIRVYGLGASAPIASNAYPAGTYFNRRIEIVVNFNG